VYLLQRLYVEADGLLHFALLGSRLIRRSLNSGCLLEKVRGNEDRRGCTQQEVIMHKQEVNMQEAITAVATCVSFICYKSARLYVRIHFAFRRYLHTTATEGTCTLLLQKVPAHYCYRRYLHTTATESTCQTKGITK